VYPTLRRKGYGTRLVRHIAEQALDRGNVKLTYYTNHDYWDRADGRGFLDSLGFYPKWEVDFEVPVVELLTRGER
jgi:GNAT superfamily N-acetyltransferase